MAEVFLISGAGYSNGAGSFGAGINPCPSGWEVTPNGNCGAPFSGCSPTSRVGKACRSPKALQLQTALAALGRTVADQALAGLPADGFVGPATVAAVNRAFTTHIGSGQAAARYRTGKLTQAQVANEADTITGIIGAEVLRRGAKLPAPVATAGEQPGPARPSTTANVPVPTAVAPAGNRRAGWALLGLSAVAAGLGFYFTYAE